MTAGRKSEVDIGLVGEVVEINPEIVRTLEGARFHSGDRADGIRSRRPDLQYQRRRCRGQDRRALKAEKLILLSDVEGREGHEGKLISTLDAAQAKTADRARHDPRGDDSQSGMLHRRSARRRRENAHPRRACAPRRAAGNFHAMGVGTEVRAAPCPRCGRLRAAPENERLRTRDGYITMNNAEIVELAHRHMVDIYGCLPLAFVRGHGAYLYDADGNRYLDFFCGLAVTSLGHGHPRVVRAIKEQAEKLTHVSNVFHTEPTRAPGRAPGHALWRRRKYFSAIPGQRPTRPRSSSRANGVTRTAADASKSSRRWVRFTAARSRR